MHYEYPYVLFFLSDDFLVVSDIYAFVRLTDAAALQVVVSVAGLSVMANAVDEKY